ncbi:SDR family NAD(P)-dependent oxidoreductase [Prauserella flavalba]|uniref:SDR family NAD(P)-dependent oxidoreductase n=1 Tax=Prauserella flavalba TaxID=1477506 RepID=UPI0036E6564E
MKVALVTGASRGIGAACAQRLAADGFAVAVSFHSAHDRAAEVVDRIRAVGGVAELFQGDVSDPAVAAELPRRVADSLGAPGVLVNNAGLQISRSMRRVADDDWRRMWNTNVQGAWFTTRAVLPYLYEAKWGRVVFVSSVLGATGGPGDTAYASTKAALLGMSKSLAMEAARRGVTSNAVLPGTIDTDLSAHVAPEVLQANIAMTAPKRAGRPEEVAAVVGFLCSSDASYVSGAEISVHGGGWLTLPPDS